MNIKYTNHIYFNQHKPEIHLQVDGGIKTNNIAQVAAAGADAVVAGSAIFNSADYAETIKAMRHALNPK